MDFGGTGDSGSDSNSTLRLRGMLWLELWWFNGVLLCMKGNDGF